MRTETIADSVTLYNGDCLTVMAELPENSVDTIITDPPYGLEFMGVNWDHGVPGIPFWEAALRVTKPGATLLAFGGTRTHHRLMCAIEDAGWEIRDMIMWVYSTGFPKSHDISKAIDKTAGAEREVIGCRSHSPKAGAAHFGQAECTEYVYSLPTTDAAKLWDGWGTALKPAWEPIILAMKPRDGTFVNNAFKWGVAGLNIDGCRIKTNKYLGRQQGTMPHPMDWGNKSKGNNGITYGHPGGRWPANLIHDGSDEVLALFPVTKSPCKTPSSKPRTSGVVYGRFAYSGSIGYADSGSAARFFYCAKPSTSEREAGLADVEEGLFHRTNSGGLERDPRWSPVPRRNTHPTVKPLALMRYLAKLTKTPTGGIVLDPFMGSGTTGMAAILEGRNFIGIEINPRYLDIAKGRIQYTVDQVDKPKQMEMNID